MSQAPLIFGSSLDRVRSRWCVWSFDVEHGDVIPLAEYRVREKSDTAAFELAHASGKLEDAAVCDRILNGKETEVAVIDAALRQLIWNLAADAVRESSAPNGRQTAISVRKTADDTVYVVRFSELAYGEPAETLLGNAAREFKVSA